MKPTLQLSLDPVYIDACRASADYIQDYRMMALGAPPRTPGGELVASLSHCLAIDMWCTSAFHAHPQRQCTLLAPTMRVLALGIGTTTSSRRSGHHRQAAEFGSPSEAVSTAHSHVQVGMDVEHGPRVVCPGGRAGARKCVHRWARHIRGRRAGVRRQMRPTFHPQHQR